MFRVYLYQRLQLQFYVLLMMGAMDTRNMQRYFAVNKYLHNVASCWILLIQNSQKILVFILEIFLTSLFLRNGKNSPLHNMLTHAQSKLILNSVLDGTEGLTSSSGHLTPCEEHPPHYPFSQRLGKVQRQAKYFGDKKSCPCRKYCHDSAFVLSLGYSLHQLSYSGFVSIVLQTICKYILCQAKFANQ